VGLFVGGKSLCSLAFDHEQMVGDFKQRLVLLLIEKTKKEDEEIQQECQEESLGFECGDENHNGDILNNASVEFTECKKKEIMHRYKLLLDFTKEYAAHLSEGVWAWNRILKQIPLVPVIGPDKDKALERTDGSQGYAFAYAACMVERLKDLMMVIEECEQGKLYPPPHDRQLLCFRGNVSEKLDAVAQAIPSCQEFEF